MTHYTKIPNKLLEAIYTNRLPFSSLEKDLVFAICRMQFGWHKSSVQISQAGLARLCNKDVQHVKKALRSLAFKGVIMSSAKGRGRTASTNLAVIADPEKWIKLNGGQIDPISGNLMGAKYTPFKALNGGQIDPIGSQPPTGGKPSRGAVNAVLPRARAVAIKEKKKENTTEKFSGKEFQPKASSPTPHFFLTEPTASPPVAPTPPQNFEPATENVAKVLIDKWNRHMDNQIPSVNYNVKMAIGKALQFYKPKEILVAIENASKEDFKREKLQFFNFLSFAKPNGDVQDRILEHMQKKKSSKTGERTGFFI